MGSSHRLPVCIVTVLILLAGCAGQATRYPPPVTLEEVVQLSKSGTPPEAILQKMRDAGTIYRLSAAELAKLHDQGVADKVLDYMQNTYLEAERREEAMRYAYPPWWYGPYPGWPYRPHGFYPYPWGWPYW